MNTRTLLLLLLCVGLTACNTVPVSRNQATAIDQKHMNYYGSGQSWTATDTNPVEVTVIRDSGGTFLGLLVPSINLYCDGKLVGNLPDPATKVTFYVAPGPHSLKVIYVNPSGTEIQGGQAGTNIVAVVGKPIEVATGVNPSSDESMRIFQTN